MATFNINIKPAVLYAAPDSFILNDDSINFIIDVLDNDSLGITPTTITSINSTGFTLGTITNNSNNLSFTSNKNLGTSSFTYTITDSISRTSNTTVTITTIV